MVSITMTGGISIEENTYTNVHLIRAKDAIDELDFDLHLPVFKSQNKVVPYKNFVTMSSDHDSFFGRVIHIETNQTDNGTITISCEGSAGFLKDSWVFPGSKDPSDTTTQEPFDLGTPKAGTTLNTIMSALLSAHNGFITDERLRMTQYITQSGSKKLEKDLELAGLTCYEAMDNIAEAFGMEWRVTGTIIRIDKRFGKYGGELKTGLNLSEISKSEDASDIYTAILPLGGIGYDEKRLSLTSEPCNEYQPGQVVLRLLMPYDNPNIGSRARPFIKNEELVKLYGIRIKLVIYDNIVVNAPEEFHDRRDELLKQAQIDCEELSKQTISFSASALDFANSPIGGPGPILTVYDYYKVTDYITGINTKLRLVKKDTNFDDILNPSLTFELDDRRNSAEYVIMGDSRPAGA